MKEAGSELGSIWLFEEPEAFFIKHVAHGRDTEAEAVKFSGSESTLKKEAESGSKLGSD